jgi:hypothetical protein
MSDAGSRVMATLVVAVTDLLFAAFGPNRKATDDLNVDIEKIVAEATPLVFVERGPRTLFGDHDEVAEAKFPLTGVIKPTAATADKLQREILKLEETLDGLLGAGTFDRVHVTIRMDGESTPFVGEKDALLLFPIVIRYAREA